VVQVIRKQRRFVQHLTCCRLILYHVTLARGLVPCCRQVAAGALCRGGRDCAGGLAGNVEAEASRRDGQLRHHTSQHGLSGTGSSRVAQAGLP
jgi:hypothetical protein